MFVLSLGTSYLTFPEDHQIEGFSSDNLPTSPIDSIQAIPPTMLVTEPITIVIGENHDASFQTRYDDTASVGDMDDPADVIHLQGCSVGKCLFTKGACQWWQLAMSNGAQGAW